MKQVELAHRLGISKSYLSMILSGKRTPSPEMARIISSQKVHKTEPVSPCKGGALPAELQPQNVSRIIAYLKLFVIAFLLYLPDFLWTRHRLPFLSGTIIVVILDVIG